MKNKYVILCLPQVGIGHYNSTASLCSALKARGHRVIFAVEASCKRLIAKYGLEEVICNTTELGEDDDFMKLVAESFPEWAELYRKDAIEQTEFNRKGYEAFASSSKFINNRVAEIIRTLKPDVIIAETYCLIPAIVTSKVPFVNFHTANLLSINIKSLPPPAMGLPLNDDSDWEKCREVYNNSVREIWTDFNSWVTREGAPRLQEYQFVDMSPYLNIFLYPRCLYEDYASLANFGDECIVIEHAVGDRKEHFHMPTEFKQKPGKIIYFSMGSMVTSDTKLMKQLLAVFAKSSHKFIVSLGAKSEAYQLADNMWGEASLPQLKILQICDLFITHGGNNSLTEAMYFGVPMIVMPMFGDQHCNAQRLVETNLGARINPFKASEQQILQTIDRVLNDKQLHEKLRQISAEIKSRNSLVEACERIEDIAALRSRLDH